MKIPKLNLYVSKRKIFSTSLFAFIIGITLGSILWNLSYVPVFMPEPWAPLSPTTGDQTETYLKRFSSYEELKNFVGSNLQTYPYYYGKGWESLGPQPVVAPFAPLSPLTFSDSGKYSEVPPPPEYSKTNVQVEGVDEADIVKTDGKYIYVVSGKNVFIAEAYPPEGARVISEISFNGTPIEIFINEDKLVVFETESGAFYQTYLITPLTIYEPPKTFIKVYDISDRENPALTRDFPLDGSYFDSRMIGNYVYAVINQPVYGSEGEVALPKIYSGDRAQEIQASNIYYANVSDDYYTYTIIVAINVQNDSQEPTLKTFLFGATRNMYVSLNNIYATLTKWDHTIDWDDGGARTLIYRIHIEGDKIECEAGGNVSGTVLNQFSMDEYNGYFRIATTKGETWSGTARNNVYVLDMNLNPVGKLEDLAPGERIYSARFMGDRCYLVTFVKIDPLFVIDLADPFNPKVLGQLKITGYSDYLHPYDETHIIGIGKETVAAEEGNFAWYQGVKISLFDVSNVSNPRQIANYTIGDRGTDSPILRDHKAFLFDRSKNLLVIPVSVAEIDEAEYPEGVPPYAYGETVWQGAYVFHISLDAGLVFRGGITHLENNDLTKTEYYVKRSLYIDDVLYTVSDKKIKMNSLEDLSEINEVELL